MNYVDLINWIKASKKTVFFGGAGVSTESGLKDFRSKDGLYNIKYKYPPEVMLSSKMFYDHTDEFYDFYKNYMNCLDVEPNITHKVLKKLEDKKLLSSIITQNIDGLHHKANSKKILELHGTVYLNHCLNCYKEYSGDFVFNSSGVPKCSCGGTIKPNVVLYGEILPNSFEIAKKEIINADLLIVAGTSLTVEPAASLVRLFRGKHLVIINKERTSYDNVADLVIHDSIGKVFEEIDKCI